MGLKVFHLSVEDVFEGPFGFILMLYFSLTGSLDRLLVRGPSVVVPSIRRCGRLYINGETGYLFPC